MFNFIDTIKKESLFTIDCLNNTLYTEYNNLLDNINVYNSRDFNSFLKKSITNPIIYSPFTEDNKKNFAFMENISSFLQSKVKDNNNFCSIIMPVYNRKDTISDSIESVLNQNYQNFELIIIDDNSNDGTITVINKYRKEYEKIILIKNPDHLGCAHSRNIGVSASKGNYIFYLDSDNTWDFRYLKTMLGAFLYLKCEAIYCGQYLFNNGSSKPYAIRFASFNISLLENRNFIDLNCFAHTRNIFNDINCFNTNLKRLIDYDFILNISKKTDIYSIPVILSNYFFNRANNTITNTEKIDDALNIIHKNLYDKINKPITLSHKVSAIIPNFENCDDLKKCIFSLRDAGCTEIIVIDNNSSIETKKILNSLFKEKIITKLIQNKINFGFSYAINQGFDIANINNDLLLVNNDSFFTTNSIYELQKYAYVLNNCGITVPRQILPAKSKYINDHVPYANSNIECDVNLSFLHKNIEFINLFSNGKSIELNFAPFFCVYLKRDIYNLVGNLDAEHGRHYRSDRIYCNKLRLLYNKKIYYIPSSKVYHKFKQSTNLLKEYDTAQYNIIFKKNKWPSDIMKLLNYKQKLWDI